MRTQNSKRVNGIGFVKTRKAISHIFLLLEDMCRVAREANVDLVGVNVDEGWSKDIDRQEISRLYQRLEEENLSAVVFQNLHDVTDDEEDFCKFMKDMNEKSIVIVDMKTHKVFLPDEKEEGCDKNE